jgi:hypothetical protein
MPGGSFETTRKVTRADSARRRIVIRTRTVEPGVRVTVLNFAPMVKV